MNIPHNKARNILLLIGYLSASAFLVTNVSQAQEVLPPIQGDQVLPDENLADEDLELLTRGPLHEAFATSAPLEPQPGVVVQKTPPEEVQELPPDYESVEGNDQDAEWIPGYWSWDDDREDFIWVSGAWRIPPFERRWVPGYWNETSEGWQWVSGFWAPDTVEQLDYVEPPPPSLEAGPSIPAPSTSHFWIPGTWVYQTNTYNWRPGYWCPYVENRVWVPAHYVWTPPGCLFVDGYWDYVLPQRGYLYAPVYFRHPVVYYRPRCAIRVGNLLLHLFVSPRYYGYYFGDYYDVGYRQRGRYPLYQYQLAARRYDPFITYYDVHYGRHGIDSRARFRGWHDYYSSHPKQRPPRTWSDQLQRTRDKDAYLLNSRTALAYTPKPHAAIHSRVQDDGRSEHERVRRDQFRDMAKQRKDLETRRDLLAETGEGRKRQLRLPPDLRTNGEVRGRDFENEDGRRSQEERLDAGRTGIRDRSFAAEQRDGRDDRRAGRQTKEDIVGQGRKRSEGDSQNALDVGPQMRRALENRGDIGRALKSQQDRRATSTAENRSVLERDSGNKSSIRTNRAGDKERRGGKVDAPSRPREVGEPRQPTRILRLNTPQSDTNSSATDARPTRSPQERSLRSRTELQRQLDASRARREANPATRAAAEKGRQSPSVLKSNTPQPDRKPRALSSPPNTETLRSRQQRSSLRSSDSQQRLDASRAPQTVKSPSRGSEQIKTRASPEQRQATRGVQSRAPKSETRASTTSAAKSASSLRSSQPRSSVSSRASSRQPSASRSRGQSSSSRVTRSTPAPSLQKSVSRSPRSTSARTQSPSRQLRQSASRSSAGRSSSRQRSSGNSAGSSKSSGRSGGKKK